MELSGSGYGFASVHYNELWILSIEVVNFRCILLEMFEAANVFGRALIKHPNFSNSDATNYLSGKLLRRELVGIRANKALCK